MPPTPDPELNAVLEALITGVRPILGDNFAGAYLQGSFAVGDADAGSDVDFLIVVNRDVPDAQVPALQAVHVRVYDVGSSWAKHLEGSYFPRAWLRDPEATTHPLLYVDNGSRVLERSKHDNTLVVRWVLREHGITLVGPEPGKLLEPIPAGALRREVLTTMQAWAREIFADPKQMNNGWYQPYAVLSYCRMLHTLDSGRVVSKPAGSGWATRTLNSRWHGLIQRATEAHAGQWLRVSQRADADDFEATLGFIQYAITVSRQFANRHDIEAPE